MKKQIFISTLKRIKIIFFSIKLIRDYYNFSKKNNYNDLIDFFHSLSDQYVYIWEQRHIGSGAFFAMNISLSTTPVEDRSILVTFNKNDTVTIQTDLHCSLQIESTTTGLDEAFKILMDIIYMYMHPELKKDEIYFGKIAKGFPIFTKGKYKTLRTGKNVLNSNGDEIKNMCPLFISPKEYIILMDEVAEEQKAVMDLLNKFFKK